MGLRGTVLGAGQVQYQQTQQYTPAPNAALLIDFDNVTMSIRSDLGKELKTLLKSDVIRGKVAVQRAYADWRRYPQYIVPLTESSVDLIFAPAYGSSKKNATDLRMAIDAIELVFTRPEIGTYILMTGDSDFSSCVLKLKEYGKYVIGVGMRESSSDLLIQNCDEYYSYHSISGLTKAGEVVESTEDPWSLVRRAVQRMVKDGDVMRTDRLKQVMIDLDPGFDEKKVGYSKFSRFVAEAQSKGVIQLRKGENGQFEILGDLPVDGEAAAVTAAPSRERVVERIVAEAAEAAGNARRGRRGRGGRDHRGPREPRPVTSGTPTGIEPLERVELEAVAPAELVEITGVAEPTLTTAEPRTADSVVAATQLPVSPASPVAEIPVDTAAPGGVELNEAYALLQEAVRRIGGREGRAVRDGDVKRKMLEINRGFNENSLGFAKFTRFLRQAHDAEVIDLNRVGAGNYEVALPAGGKKLAPPRVTDPGVPGVSMASVPVAAPAAAPSSESSSASTPASALSPEDAAPVVASPGVASGRTRQGRGRRTSAAASGVAKPEATTPEAIRPEAIRPEVTVSEVVPEVTKPASGVVSAPRKAAPAAPVTPVSTPVAVPAAAEPSTPSFGALRGRRGGRVAPSGPPPILPGQGVPSSVRPATIAPELPAPLVETVAPAAPEPMEAADASAAPDAGESRSRSRNRRGRRGRGGRSNGESGAALEGTDLLSPVLSEEAAARESGSTVDSTSSTAPVEPGAVDVAGEPAPERSSRGRSRSRGRRGRGNGPAASGEAAVSTEIPVAEAVVVASEAAPVVLPEPAPAASAGEGQARTSRRGRGRGRGAAAEAEKLQGRAAGVPAVKTPVVPSPSVPAVKTPAATAVAPVSAAFPASALGLPETSDEITTYLTTKYKGIGKKTAETLLDRFGAGLFEAMQNRPEEVKKALDERRGGALLEQWAADYAKRQAPAEKAPRASRGARSPRKAEVVKPAPAAPAVEAAPRGRRASAKTEKVSAPEPVVESPRPAARARGSRRGSGKPTGKGSSS
jgi:uncharacterized protein (TIGR00288 family)